MQPIEPIGHKFSVQLLQAALDQSRVHNGYLLVGPKGIGKRTVARWFAEQLLRTPKKQSLPLDGHPDFYTLEPLEEETGKRSMVKLEAVQSLLGYLRQQPLVSSRSVVLIDQADSLTISAANALLKTLEEPRKAVLLLTTERPDKLLTTIGSRCQTLYLELLTEPACRAVLTPYVSDVPPELLALSPGQPGVILQSCRTVNALAVVKDELQQGAKTAHACLALAQKLKVLTQTQQLWLLQWWQQTAKQTPHLAAFDQAIAQLSAHVQAELVWDALLLQLCEQGAATLGLPASASLHEPVQPATPESPTKPTKAKSRQTPKSDGSKPKGGTVTQTLTDQSKEPTATTAAAPTTTTELKQLSLFKRQ